MRALAFSFALMLIACGGDIEIEPVRPDASDAATEAGFDGGLGGMPAIDADTFKCPAKASHCDPPCTEIKAAHIDLTKFCIVSFYTIGCWENPGEGGGAIGCVRDPVSDTRYMTLSHEDSEYLVATGQWVDCTPGWGVPNTVCD